MSYKKMMNKSMRSKIRSYKASGKMFGQTFSTLDSNQRRKSPWLGSCWFEDGMEQKRIAFIKEWQEETARMLKANPKLEIV